MKRNTQLISLIILIALAALMLYYLPVKLDKYLMNKNIITSTNDITSITFVKNFNLILDDGLIEYVKLTNRKDILSFVALLSSCKIRRSYLSGINVLSGKIPAKSYQPPYYISIHQKNNKPIMLYNISHDYILINDYNKNNYLPLKLWTGKETSEKITDFADNLFSEYSYVSLGNLYIDQDFSNCTVPAINHTGIYKLRSLLQKYNIMPY